MGNMVGHLQGVGRVIVAVKAVVHVVVVAGAEEVELLEALGKSLEHRDSLPGCSTCTQDSTRDRNLDGVSL